MHATTAMHAGINFVPSLQPLGGDLWNIETLRSFFIQSIAAFLCFSMEIRLFTGFWPYKFLVTRTSVRKPES